MNRSCKDLKILNDKKGLNIGARHISISTAGIPAKIKKFAREKTQVNLAVSLNAPDDDIRSRIMPINLSHPIAELIESVKYYISVTNRKVMFEYVMLNGLNDSMEDAEKLVRLLKGLLCFVNPHPL